MGLLSLCLHAFLFIALGKKKGRDFYKILELSKKKASQPNAIKKAYRKLAMKWHPDRNQDNIKEAEEKMQNINAAYEVLSDPEKKRKYDQVGEEEAGGGGGGQGGNPQDIFDMFFNQGGGGGGGGFHFGGGGPFGGGGQRGGGERQIFKGTDISEWGQEQYDEMASSMNIGEFTTVVFYKAAGANNLKDAILDVHRTYSNMMKIAAVNCGIKQSVCNGGEREKITDGKSRLVIYWREGEKKTLQKKKYFIGDSDGKKLTKWISTALPESSIKLKSVDEMKKWAQNENAGKVILFTDKSNTPPLIKVFGAKFLTKVDVGIVHVGKTGILKNEIAMHFGAETTPSLLFLSDRAAVKGEFFTSKMDNKWLDMWFSKVYMNHRKEASAAKVRELTLVSYKGGACGPKVSDFCLVYMEQPNEKRTNELNQIAHGLKDDHVKVYWVNPDNFGFLADEFGDKLVVLWRPKRRKWKGYEEAISNKNTEFAQTISSWVSNTVNGGAPLPNKISDKFYRDEL